MHHEDICSGIVCLTCVNTYQYIVLHYDIEVVIRVDWGRCPKLVAAIELFDERDGWDFQPVLKPGEIIPRKRD